MIIRYSLGIPMLFVSLGMGIIFSLPVVMTSIGTSAPSTTCTPVLATNVKKATMILTGQVDTVLQDGSIADVWVTPITWYKGKTDAQYIHIPVRVMSATNSASNDIHFATGQPPYLLFLRQNTGGKFQTSACYGSRFLGSGLTVVEAKLLHAQ